MIFQAWKMVFLNSMTFHDPENADFSHVIQKMKEDEAVFSRQYYIR